LVKELNTNNSDPSFMIREII